MTSGERLKFFTGTWASTPSDNECYAVPLNPQSASPVDSLGASYRQGLQTTTYTGRLSDNRIQELVWENIPATEHYMVMLNALKSYVGYDYVYIHLGNSLLTGLYGTGDSWHKIRAIAVPVDYQSGVQAYMSGGVAYNKYRNIKFRFRVLEDM